MSKKISYSVIQSGFYDINPPLVTWPKILKQLGFTVTYKPREVFWKKHFDKVLSKRQKILYIGCGQGLMLKRLSESYQVKGIGIDVSEKSIKYANENYAAKNLLYKVANGTKIPFKDNSFDAVLSFDTLEHIEDQSKAVSEMARVLKPGGKMLIYTMNKFDQYTLDWFWEKLGFDIYSRAAHQRELFVDPKWLTDKLELQDINIKSVKYVDSFFTLLVDEVIMVSINLFKTIGMFKYDYFGKLILLLLNWISKIVYPFVMVLDYPWLKKKYSLGFIVVAEK